jgi:hemoglobin-like flavoprotein
MTEAARGTAELTQAFEILAERDIDLSPQIYERFFQLRPDAEGLMQQADANMRGRMLDQTFELLMDPELLGPESYFRWEVTNHVSAYSVSPDMYGPYFQAMGEALAPALGDAWTRQIASAWQVRVADLLQDLDRASA